MILQQNRNFRRLLASAVFLLLGISLVLSVGVAYGRYNSSISGSMQFVLRKPSRFYLFSQKTSDGETWNANLNWISSGTDGTRVLPLCVSNTDQTGKEISPDDLTVRIRLFVPEGQEDEDLPDPNGNLKIRLRNEENGMVYEADSNYLSTLTPLYLSNEKKGWIYCFSVSPPGTNDNDNGNGNGKKECAWVLPGGTVSDLTVTLILENETVSTEGFRLYVDRVGVYR